MIATCPTASNLIPVKAQMVWTTHERSLCTYKELVHLQPAQLSTPDVSPQHAVAPLLLWVGCLAGLYPIWLAGHAHTWQQNAAKQLPYGDL